ncbi:MAG TPA: hypothetical protein PKY77_12385 [Phycisphaerae bacterium]|nr:hypothetical protein [Phycisphaerae bacterium]HRY70390.1 hypothetical protein [Phycisphaerae bacterium]HSA28107.1 hypothetical protein [Phycisphaerae bacterium]
MTSSFSMVGMPGALELLVIGVIVGAVILVIGPQKARTALGVVLVVAVTMGLLWFVAMPYASHVSSVPASTVHSTIGPMSVTIEGTSYPSDNTILPAPPSLEPPVPAVPQMPVAPPAPDLPRFPGSEHFGFNHGPLPTGAVGGTRMNLAILALIILLAVIAGLVALFVRSRRPGRIVIGVLAGIFLLLFFSLFAFRMSASHERIRLGESVREELSLDGATLRERASQDATAIRNDVRAKAAAMRQQASREAERARSQITGNGSRSTGPVTAVEWTPSEQHAFEADLYPSKQSAAVALARHSLNQFLAELMPNETLRVVHLSVSQDLNGAILDRMTQQITQQVTLAASVRSPSRPPGVPLHVTVDSVREITSAPAPLPAPTPGAMTMRFVTTRDLPAEQSANSEVGEIRLTLRTQGGELVRTARFVNAPWTEDFTRWTQQGPGTWVLGESDQLWPTEDQARADAFQRAAEGVERHLRDYIARTGRYTPVSVFAERPGWLMNQITGELQSGSLVKTEFNQGFERPYGKVYRRAVLVKLPPEQLQKLADRYYRHVDQVRETWGRSVKSSLALLALIFVVYLILNAATRGYYLWVMRTAAGVAAVIGVVVILLCVA